MPNKFSGFFSPNPRPDIFLIPACLALAGAWLGFAGPFFPPAILLFPVGLILAATRAAGRKAAFWAGFGAAWPAYAASLYWLAIPVHEQGGLPWILAGPCPVLVACVPAAYAGLFALGVFHLRHSRHQLAAALCAGLLWAALEVARNHLLTGFPWLTLSQALAPWPWTLGLAAWVGAFGLSGMVVAICHLLVLGQGRARLWTLALALCCLLPGLAHNPGASSDHASVSMIQGNIDQNLKWDEAMQASILDTYIDLATKAVQEKQPDLLIWPETAIPFYFQDPNDLSSALAAAVDAFGAPLLTGAPAYSVPRGPDAPPYVLHNRAYLLAGPGKILGWYDKEHLVPFGEYVPLGRWLPFVTRLAPGQFDFQPGRDFRTLKTGKLALGILICYEAIFPELAQKHVGLGANVLVNISNDAWFGYSAAPRQHLYLTVLRAVEQNRTIVRATNTGISALIGPDGSVRQATDLFTTAIVHADDVALLTETTFYHEHFTFVHLAFPLLGLGLLIALTWKRST